MNDTRQASPPPPPPPPAGSSGPTATERDFDPHRLRTITDMERSSDDRIVAGVCAGAARYLDIDPVVVRVVMAVLTVAGFAGLILYVAAWLLLPADDEDRSIVARWFSLDRNEEQVRVIGLVVAVILAVLSFVGDSSWAWWSDTSWWIVPLGLLFYLFWVRPRRRRDAHVAAAVAAATAAQDSGTDTAPQPTVAFEPTHGGPATMSTRTAKTPKVTKIREPRSPALLVLTSSVAAIALAATWIYDETRLDVHWTTYVAVALAVVAIGLLVGTVVGNGGWLIAIGLVLAVTLAIGSVFPTGRIGSQTPAPTVASDVDASYRHGIGELVLDLSEVSDVSRLQGRRITLDNGIGETRVIVPDGLKVDVDVHLGAGEIELFGRVESGTDVSLADVADQPDGTALSIAIDQNLGHIVVMSR